jgi:hypothetical protein
MTLDDLLADQDEVVDTGTALKYVSRDTLRWRIESGRWQQPCRGIVVAHSGPLTQRQRLWVATFWGGSGAALGGLTAARLSGLRGFDRDEQTIHLLRPVSRKARASVPPLNLAVHYSSKLDHAAVWMVTDRGAQAVLAAGVQQRLVRVGDLMRLVEENERLPRRTLIRATLGDIEGGSQALSELDFMANVVRGCHVPVPTRQAPRRDARGKRRWLDVFYEEARLAIEIDGAGHLDILEYWADMSRENELKLAGYTVLRFPAYIVRYYPEQVARAIRKAYANAGIRI